MRQDLPIDEEFSRWLPEDIRCKTIEDLETDITALSKRFRNRHHWLLGGFSLLLLIAGLCGILAIADTEPLKFGATSIWQVLAAVATILTLISYEELRRMSARRPPLVLRPIGARPLVPQVREFLALCHAEGEAEWVGLHGERRPFRPSGFLRPTAIALLSPDPDKRAVGFPPPPGMIDPELHVMLPNHSARCSAIIDLAAVTPNDVPSSSLEGQREPTPQSRHKRVDRNETVYCATRTDFEAALTLAFSPHLVDGNKKQLHYGALAIFDVWEREPSLRNFNDIMARAFVRFSEIAPSDIPRFSAPSDRSFRRLLDQEHAKFRDIKTTLTAPRT